VIESPKFVTEPNAVVDELGPVVGGAGVVEVVVVEVVEVELGVVVTAATGCSTIRFAHPFSDTPPHTTIKESR
jgi:small ligand-binding sensory domain FIST